MSQLQNHQKMNAKLPGILMPVTQDLIDRVKVAVMLPRNMAHIQRMIDGHRGKSDPKSSGASSTSSASNQAAGSSSDVPSSSNNPPPDTLPQVPAPEDQGPQDDRPHSSLNAPRQNVQPEPEPAPEAEPEPTLNDRLMAMAEATPEMIVETVFNAAATYSEGVAKPEKLVLDEIRPFMAGLLQRGTPGECVCWPSLPDEGCPQHKLLANKSPRKGSNDFTANTRALLLKVFSLNPKPAHHEKKLIRWMVDKSMKSIAGWFRKAGTRMQKKEALAPVPIPDQGNRANGGNPELDEEVVGAGEEVIHDRIEAETGDANSEAKAGPSLKRNLGRAPGNAPKKMRLEVKNGGEDEEEHLEAVNVEKIPAVQMADGAHPPINQEQNLPEEGHLEAIKVEEAPAVQMADDAHPPINQQQNLLEEEHLEAIKVEEAPAVQMADDAHPPIDQQQNHPEEGHLEAIKVEEAPAADVQMADDAHPPIDQQQNLPEEGRLEAIEVEEAPAMDVQLVNGAHPQLQNVPEEGLILGVPTGNEPNHIQMFSIVFNANPNPGQELLRTLSTDSGLSANHIEEWFRRERNLQRERRL